VNNQDIINKLLTSDAFSLKEVFSALAKGFGQKAEKIYDENPEENGLTAQPFADLGDLCAEASTVFDEPEEIAVDDGFPVEQSAPVTVTQAIQAQAIAKIGNPWGGR
jgi:hypothetical protein